MYDQEPTPVGAAGPLPDDETELKLRGQPDALKAIFAGPAICGKATGRGSSRRLENVYYDTADQRLRARGLAFRVRRDGRRYVQTLKSGDVGGLVAYRGEWQTPLGSAAPDLGLLPSEASQVLDGLVTQGDLRSLFTTRVRRQTRRLAATVNGGPPSLIEAALDVGAIEADGRSQPIAEIELELIEGSPRALYDLALELDALTPLQVETRSKSVRGYTLAGGKPPAWCKAEAVALAPKATVDAAIGRILRACVQHWCANEAAALDGRDPEGVHQLRVALRRLRSAVSVFGHLIHPERRSWLTDEARRILGSLGPARDWDVFLTESLPPMLATRPDDRSLVALGAAAEVGAHGGLCGGPRGDRRPLLHPLPAPARPLDRGPRLARGRDAEGGRLARPADRRVRRPAARKAPPQGAEARPQLRRSHAAGAPPAADRAQEAALRDRVLRQPPCRQARAALSRSAQAASGRARPSERRRGRRAAFARPRRAGRRAARRDRARVRPRARLARPRRRRGRAAGPGRLADLRRAQTILELTRARRRSIDGR